MVATPGRENWSGPSRATSRACPEPAPDSKKLAIAASNRLFVADVEGGAVTEVAHNQAGGYQLASFSPDAKWLLYTRRDDNQNADVYVPDIAAKTEHIITASPFNDSRPVITPDSSRVIFVSDRDGGASGSSRQISRPRRGQRASKGPHVGAARERPARHTARPPRPRGSMISCRR